MKKISLFKSAVIVGLLALTTVGIQSCKKDEDPDRDAFFGSYSISSGTITCGVSGNSTINAGTALIITENSTGDNKVSISIGGFLSVVGTVSGTSVSIDNQTISGFTYTGTGTINGNTFTLSLSEYDVSVPETCVYSIAATK